MNIQIIDWGGNKDSLKPYTHGQEIEVSKEELVETSFKIAREFWDKGLNVMLCRRPDAKGIRIAVDIQRFQVR